MHGKKIAKNSILGIAYKVTILLLAFVSRKIFILYLGEELLGLNSLYSNLLELLNMAELGLGVAVQYQLYEPLVKNNKEEISKIISAARKIYNLLGTGILCAGSVMAFTIQYLIKSTTYPLWYVRVAFVISVIGVASSYYFVHLKLFFQANEEMGIINIMDMCAKIIVVVISIISLIFFRNYFLYLGINMFNGILSNIFTFFYFKKKYPYLKTNCKDIIKQKKVLTSDLKNVLPWKLSNYIYNSTDNMVISRMLGLTTVALYSNYMQIINGIMSMEYLWGNAITSSMGKIMKEQHNSEKVYSYFSFYQYLQYLFTSFCTISFAIICTPFVKWWIGERFIIRHSCFILLIFDFFVHSMYQPASVMYSAAGKFREDKYITIISSAMNLTLSIILVKIIGLEGVIIGTFTSDIFIWIIRSYQIVKKEYLQSLMKYVIKMVYYIFLTILGYLLVYFVSMRISVKNLLFEITIKMLLCIIIPNLLNVLCTIRTKEFGMLGGYIGRWKMRRS